VILLHTPLTSDVVVGLNICTILTVCHDDDRSSTIPVSTVSSIGAFLAVCAVKIPRDLDICKGP